ncbi:MAG: hypothetical protein ACM3ML_14085 [Micromonosporaceae bacterium]
MVTATGAQIVKTPAQAPRANAIAGRWTGSIRRECLDQMLIGGQVMLRLPLRRPRDSDRERLRGALRPFFDRHDVLVMPPSKSASPG